MTTKTPAARPSNDEIREQQKQAWNKFAPGWKKWDPFMMEFLRPCGEAILKEARLQSGWQVLDAACGTGEPGLTAAAQVGPKGKVTGTDLSEEMIAVAREKAKARGIACYEAQAADASSLPFPDARFDAVLCRMGVMFFPDPARTIKEFFRVLKPGGRLALCAWTGKEKNDWATTIGDIVNAELGVPPPPPDTPGLFRQGAPGTLAGLLKGAGFAEAAEREIGGSRDYESAAVYWQMFTEVAAPIAGPLAKADEATRAKARAKVVAAAEAKAKNGRPAFSWGAWIASGVKP